MRDVKMHRRLFKLFPEFFNENLCDVPDDSTKFQKVCIELEHRYQSHVTKSLRCMILANSIEYVASARRDFLEYFEEHKDEFMFRML